MSVTITEKQLSYLIALLGKAGVIGWSGAQNYMAQHGVHVERFEDLTMIECDRLIGRLKGFSVAPAPATDKDGPW